MNESLGVPGSTWEYL
jgi:hypothetical protein